MERDVDQFSTMQYAALVTRLADESAPEVRLEMMQQMLRFEFEWINRAIELGGLTTAEINMVNDSILKPMHEAGRLLVTAATATRALNG